MANKRCEPLSLAGEICLDALIQALVPRWRNHEQEEEQKYEEKKRAVKSIRGLVLIPRGNCISPD